MGVAGYSINKLISSVKMVPFQWFFISVLLLAVAWVAIKIFRRKKTLVYTLKHDLGHGHRWLTSEFTSKPTYCSTCMQFCVSGSCCEMCGLCICPEMQCLKSASASNTCKPLAIKTDGHMSHSWIRGNLPLSSECFKCLSPCGNVPTLADFQCVWCQKTVHEECVQESDWKETPCTLGPHQRIIIPPNCLTVQEEGWRAKKSLVVKQVNLPNIDGWRPLLVFANPRSGGKDGEEVISMLRRLLNPVQVVDILETAPENALEICRLIPHVPVRVMVCGGDGTVGWVLGAIDKANLPNTPQVGILPLGTGNDLARVLGWGPGFSSDDDISDILKEMEHAHLSLLDRWNVIIDPKKRYLGLHHNTKVFTMNNYLGIGCAAGVALNFHRQRESRPELFTSRLINKAWYAGFGARDMVEQSCKDFPNKVELYVDGVLTKLNNLEGIVVLNINSWSAGCTMWNELSSPNNNWVPSRMDDNMLELVGLLSTFHVGKIQVSVAEPIHLGQAKNVKIVLNESLPIQIDGEPWQQGPCTIKITHQGKAHMLRKVSS